jgi:alpha-L-arabinofuranosidase
VSEYKDFTVTRGDDQLFHADLASAMEGWKPHGGKWAVRDGALAETEEREDSRITTGDGSWQDYSVSVKARRVSGNEGFLVLFHVRDDNNFCWFNVGGWNNTRNAIERSVDGNKASLAEAPFKIETGRWYDLRVDVQGRDIKCFIDGKQVLSAKDEAPKPVETLFAAASRDESSGDVILKVVNAKADARRVEINLQGAASIASDATIARISGQPTDVNTIDAPEKVATQQVTIHDAAATFTHEFPGNSVSVVRLKTR